MKKICKIYTIDKKEHKKTYVKVPYTTTTTKTAIQISNLRLSSEDENNYYFAFDGNLTAGYVEAQISTDKDFNDIRSCRYLWSNDDEKTICVPKSDLESEKTYF